MKAARRASVHFLCPNCDSRLEAPASGTVATCDSCGAGVGVSAPEPNQPVEGCAACGEDEMFVQKDFNRATGIALVVVGAAFVPFLQFPWNFVPLALVTLLDLFLYNLLAEVEVCYRCHAVYRGFPRNPNHKPFDLATHDRHLYGAAPPGAEEQSRD